MARLVGLLLAILVGVAYSTAEAAGPRVLAEGKLPADARLSEPKDLNGYFPFTVAKSKEEWEKRAKAVKRQIAVSQGIWPEPEKTPLNAVVHGKMDRGDYTVEKVFFESVPGFFVTGNLYRPKGKSGKVPAVLFPHGHWDEGRFYDNGRKKTRQEIVIGSERFEEGGRSLLQAMPVQLARMGCICFNYDMIGYADSKQLSFDLGHRFAKQRAEMNSAENWGLFSPQAEANLQSIMGLQTWGSVRAIDFLLGLPDVDGARIAVTGASGGGTQTMLLAGIDPRVALSFPAVMVSTAMQGGCTCENASCLRVDTGNIEFAALFAPKPQGMTAANDWTKELATKGFPDIKQHYKLMGAENNVMMTNNIHFNHNYNYVNRAAFFGFLNKHFKLGLEDPVVEEDYKRLTPEEMTVWDSAHPKPASGDDFERKLCRQLAEASKKQLEALEPKDEKSLAKWREVVGGGFQTIIGRGLPAKGETDLEPPTRSIDAGNHFQLVGILQNKAHGEKLPVVVLRPKNRVDRAVIWLSEQGKSAIFADDGTPVADVKRLLDSGAMVVGVDLLYQGEFLSQGELVGKNRVVKNPREFAGYTYGYNYPLLAQQSHDILSVVAWLKSSADFLRSIEVIALDRTAVPAVAALAVSDGAINRAAIDTKGFRFGKLTDYRDANFLPGGAKYGDLPGMLSLAAPAKLWLGGETEASAELVKKSYAAAGKKDGVVLGGSEGKQAAVEWIVKGE